MMDNNDYIHCCRYCKHYRDGLCFSGEFVVYVKDEDIIKDDHYTTSDDFEIGIEDPENFYCSSWE